VPLVTIMTGCFNEEENVAELYTRVRTIMEAQTGYTYRHLFIDNASKDGTVDILREIAAEDPRVQVIVNTRNFGPNRSPYHAFLVAEGDAIIPTVADLQDPPELIPAFLRKWEEGYKVVIGIKSSSEESQHMFRVRRLYYWLLGKLSSDVELIPNFTGYGLYDREVVESFRETDELIPYFRGLLCEFGYERAEIEYVQPARARGVTKNSLYALYDQAMLGITSHSKIPLRIATLTGFAISILSLLVAFLYLVTKLVFWNSMQLGTAPLLIGIYFFGAVQLFFIGVLGEYIGSIHTQVHKRPRVVERERINFDSEPGRRSRRGDRDGMPSYSQAPSASPVSEDKILLGDELGE
jgi:polyisoprenyl-phosphate glycosyltransferase